MFAEMFHQAAARRLYYYFIFFFSLSLSVCLTLVRLDGSLFARKTSESVIGTSRRRRRRLPDFGPVERVRKTTATAACQLHQHFCEISRGYRHRRQRRAKCLRFVRGGERERAKLANQIYLHQTRGGGQKPPREHE